MILGTRIVVEKAPDGARRTRSYKRRRAWLAHHAERHMELPNDRLWLLHDLGKTVEASAGPLGKFVRAYMSLSAATCHRRCIFPLPLVEGDFARPRATLSCRWALLRQFVNIIIACLNFLYGVPFDARPQRTQTCQHRDVQSRLVGSVHRFVCRLNKAPVDEIWKALPAWVGRDTPVLQSTFCKLKADLIDTDMQAGRCDPTPFLDMVVQSLIEDPQRLFEGKVPGMSHFARFTGGEASEYAILVTRQLLSGKLGLAAHVTSGGPVVCVGKSSGAQREIWNGQRVSLAAQKPPAPPHLASPTCFAMLEASELHPLRVSKRDARSYFDQLLAPPCLRPWFGRPPVTIDALLGSGLIDIERILACFEDDQLSSWDRTSPVFPVSRVWPMGFSWSPHVAQKTLLSVAAKSGLGQECWLSPALPIPDSDVKLTIATDDAMIFSNLPSASSEAATKLDIGMEMTSIEKNRSKDIDDALDAMCIGVALEDGLRFVAPSVRCVSCLFSVLWLSSSLRASPAEIAQLHGQIQWYDLILRLKLSIYSKIYSFTKDATDRVRRPLPLDVLEELVLAIILGPFWECDLTLKYCDLLLCCDASTSFGFGGAVCPTSIDQVRSIGSRCCMVGDYVVLDDGVHSGDYSDRLGRQYGLDIAKEDFVNVFSIRKKRNAHINELEAHAFILLLEWALRSRRRHSTRLVILTDSAVWCGAVCKGRSGTHLNRLLRRCCALVMAGNLRLHVVLIPSAENPSDAASRGEGRSREKRVVHGAGRQTLMSLAFMRWVILTAGVLRSEGDRLMRI